MSKSTKYVIISMETIENQKKTKRNLPLESPPLKQMNGPPPFWAHKLTPALPPRTPLHYYIIQGRLDLTFPTNTFRTPALPNESFADYENTLKNQQKLQHKPHTISQHYNHCNIRMYTLLH